MKTLHIIFTLILLSIALGSSAWSWDCMYDGSVLPDDPALGSQRWTVVGCYDHSIASTDGSLLHIANTAASGMTSVGRFGIPSASPLTMEARVKVVSGWAGLDAGSPSYATTVGVAPDQILVTTGKNQSVCQQTTPGVFHTIRIATTAQAETYVWLDGVFLMRDTTTMVNQGNISFIGGASSDSYWDYVAYSNAFIPLAIPEPSSLLALLAGVGGIGSVAWRRRALVNSRVNVIHQAAALSSLVASFSA